MTDHDAPIEPGPAGRTDRPGDVLHSGPRTSTRRGARLGLVAAAVGVIALGAAGVSTVALADSGSGSGTAALASVTGAATESKAARAADRDRWRDRHGPGGLRGLRGMGGMGGAPLHGEFVVPKGEGSDTYRTIVVARGKASAISATAITVTSADGFVQTYVVNADTRVPGNQDDITKIKDGAQVMVMGERNGSSVTALHAVDVDSLGERFGHGGHGSHRGHGGHGPMGGPMGGATGGPRLGSDRASAVGV